MTNYGVTITRGRTRDALDRALGHRSTNKEHNDFLTSLNRSTGYPEWLQKMAEKYVKDENEKNNRSR